MTRPEDVLRRVVGALDEAGIPYMLTGSFAGAVHGVPRATQDIDMVIAPTEEQVQAFCASFSPTEYYVDAGMALEAIAQESMFNVIDQASAWKVDLIIRKTRRFSREEFARRWTVDALGLELQVVSPEDLIIAKLEWARTSQSARQLEDAASLLRARCETLDLAHIERWVKELGLDIPWTEARRIAAEQRD